MNKLIQRFVVWYLKKHNAKFDYGNYVVRIFSAEYYNRLMLYAKHIEPINCRCSLKPIFNIKAGDVK